MSDDEREPVDRETALSALFERQLDGFDPYDELDRESARIDAFLRSLVGEQWSEQTRCADWDRRALAAHLAGTEQYHRACLDDALGDLFAAGLAAGATDVNSFNAVGVRQREGMDADEVVEEWAALNAANRADFRARDGGLMSTSVGPYPVRRQAFHVASELATHADDMGVPLPGGEASHRLEWRKRFSRFSLAEGKPDLDVDLDGLSDEELVEGAAGRLPPDHPLARALSTVP